MRKTDRYRYPIIMTLLVIPMAFATDDRIELSARGHGRAH